MNKPAKEALERIGDIFAAAGERKHAIVTPQGLEDAAQAVKVGVTVHFDEVGHITHVTRDNLAIARKAIEAAGIEVVECKLKWYPVWDSHDDSFTDGGDAPVIGNVDDYEFYIKRKEKNDE